MGNKTSIIKSLKKESSYDVISKIKDLTEIDEQEKTALFYADYDTNILEYLVRKGLDINHRDSFGNNAFWYFKRMSSDEFMLKKENFDIKNINNKGENVLFRGHLSENALKICKQKGVDFKKLCNNGEFYLNKETCYIYPEYVYLLHKYGCDVNQKDGKGNPPIFYFVKYAHPDCVRMLLQCGASPHFRDPDGNSLVHYAIFPATVTVLIAEGLELDEDNCNAIIKKCGRRYANAILHQLPAHRTRAMRDMLFG